MPRRRRVKIPKKVTVFFTRRKCTLANYEVEETTSESQSKGTIFRDVAIQAEPCPHDDELWFEHGNLTLITSDVEFRVWKGPLVFHSPVFRDMLSLPQSPRDAQSPSSPGPTSTSHAVVHVSDSNHDLRQFLRVFFTGDTFSGCVSCRQWELVP